MKVIKESWLSKKINLFELEPKFLVKQASLLYALSFLIVAVITLVIPIFTGKNIAKISTDMEDWSYIATWISGITIPYITLVASVLFVRQLDSFNEVSKKQIDSLEQQKLLIEEQKNLFSHQISTDIIYRQQNSYKELANHFELLIDGILSKEIPSKVRITPLTLLEGLKEHDAILNSTENSAFDLELPYLSMVMQLASIFYSLDAALFAMTKNEENLNSDEHNPTFLFITYFKQKYLLTLTYIISIGGFEFGSGNVIKILINGQQSTRSKSLYANFEDIQRS